MAEFYPSPEKVRAILLAEGSLVGIADKYGVSSMTVRNYKCGKSARARAAIEALRSDGHTVVPISAGRSTVRLTSEQVAEIMAAKGASVTSKALGKKYGVKDGVIRMIWCGRTYK